MILVYVSIILILLYDIKIFKPNEYNLNPLSLNNSNAMKGLSAIVVVLHHISQRLYNPGYLFLFRYLGYLSVSLFFFYSGYGLMKSYESKCNYLNDFWINRMPKIIIPFIISNILFILIHIVLVGTKFSAYDIFTYILGIRLIDDYKWYIISIVIFYSSFYFLFKYYDRNKSIIGIFILITCYNFTCFLLKMGNWWYNTSYCFLIGIIFGAYYKYVFSFIRKKYIIVTLALLSIFILTFILQVTKENIFISSISSACFVLVCICLLTKFDIDNKIINLLGSISYEIYLVHRLILDGFSGINNKYIYLTLCTLLSILIAYIFNIFVKIVVDACMSISHNKYKIQV